MIKLKLITEIIKNKKHLINSQKDITRLLTLKIYKNIDASNYNTLIVKSVSFSLLRPFCKNLVL